MSIYKTRIGFRGSLIYIKDGRPYSTKKVPSNVAELLKTYDEVDDTDLPPAPVLKPCVFCGDHSKFEKTIDMQTVYICNEHYYSKTTGQIAHKFRRINDEGNGKTKEANEETIQEENDEKRPTVLATAD